MRRNTRLILPFCVCLAVECTGQAIDRSTAAPVSDDPVVTTEAGQLRGVIKDGIVSYLGIPCSP
jgi:hypothetical protein